MRHGALVYVRGLRINTLLQYLSALLYTLICAITKFQCLLSGQAPRTCRCPVAGKWL